jgi:hypothetical protein
MPLAGSRLFEAGEVLTAEQVQFFLMNQSIMGFTDTTARDAAFGGTGEPTLFEGMFAYTADTNTLWYYTGSAWEYASSTTQALNSNTVTTTPYTFVASDAGELVICNSSSAIGLVIPLNSSVPFPIGTQINVMQLGTGIVAFAGTVGTTLNSNGNKFRTNGQYAVGTLIKVDTDTWVAIGNLQV